MTHKTKIAQDIRKRFGDRAVTDFDSMVAAAFDEVDVIPTGSPTLDTAIGVGGLPRGRVVEVFAGQAHTEAMRTITLRAVAHAQSLGLTVAWIDGPGHFNPTQARNEGVRLEHLLVSQPDTSAMAVEIAEQLAKTGVVDLIVGDTILKADGADEDTMGLHARVMSAALRRLTAVAYRANSVVVLMHERSARTGMAFAPESEPGQNALKFYSSLRLEVRSVGNKALVKVIKNKVAPPFLEAEIDL